MVDNAMAGRRVLVAGATGYLGSRVTRALAARGARVRAVVRGERAVDGAAEVVRAEVTDPGTLRGVCDGVDWVFSAVGITRQRDGLRYEDVDFGANVALLREAERAGVRRFGVISVVGAERLRDNPMVGAKLRFLDVLRASSVAPRVVAATGFFNDMTELLAMASRGRVFLLGDGTARSNPVAGEDVAEAAVDALAGDADHVEVGGPDVLSWNGVARLAFEAIGARPRVTHVPAGLVRGLLPAVGLFSRRASTVTEFFLEGTTHDVVAPRRGRRTLAAHFAEAARGASAVA